MSLLNNRANRIEAEKAGPTIFSEAVTAVVAKTTLGPGRYTILPLFGDSPEVSPAGYCLQMEADLYAVVTAEDVIALGVPMAHDTEIPIGVNGAGEGVVDGYVAWVLAAGASEGTIRCNSRSRAARLSDR